MDQYGDNLSQISREGCSYHVKHDRVRDTVHALCKWAGMTVNKEIYNYVSQFFTEEAHAKAKQEAEANRRKNGDESRKWIRKQYEKDLQVIIPDLRIGATPGAQLVGLAEVKTLNCGDTNYPGPTTLLNQAGDQRFVTPAKDRAVEVKARKVNGEYTRKLTAVEGGTVDNPGPALRYFQDNGGVTPIVVGAYGEANQKLHALIGDIVRARTQVAMRVNDAGRSLAFAIVRNSLGMAAITADAERRVAAAQWVGPNAEKNMRERDEQRHRNENLVTLREELRRAALCLTHPARD